MRCFFLTLRNFRPRTWKKGDRERMRVSQRLKLLSRPLIRPIVSYLKFFWYESIYVDGPRDRVVIGSRCGLSNTIFNTASGRIEIGDYSAFGYNVMLLTGRHRFVDGQRAGLGTSTRLYGGGQDEVPDQGYDIYIGEGCWIGSGVIISGGVSIGPNSIVAAGSVVLDSFPEGSFLAGTPAKRLKSTSDRGTR